MRGAQSLAEASHLGICVHHAQAVVLFFSGKGTTSVKDYTGIPTVQNSQWPPPEQACIARLNLYECCCRARHEDKEWEAEPGSWEDWAASPRLEETLQQQSLVDDSTAEIIDKETEEDFDWRAELLQLEQENRRNEV